MSLYVESGYWDEGYIDEATAPAEVQRQPGGFIPRPVIYLDRDGKPVSLQTVAERAVEAAPEAQEAVEAAVARIEQADLTAPITAALAADYALLADALAQVDAALSLALAAEARRQDDELAILLLMAM